MNDNITTARRAKDPLCVSELTGSFASYSELLKSEPGAVPLAVTAAEPRKLTRATVIAHSVVENYYAPLIAVIDANTDMPFTIGGSIVLLTDPLRLANSIRNWAAAGIAVPTVATAVLRNDDQFDSLVAAAILEDLGVVIDPTLDLAGKPVTGFDIRYFADLIESAPSPQSS